MQFFDFSPRTIPTIEEQRDALQKGLGRAMQWAIAGKLAYEPLLEVCLHDHRYDTQTENNRGEWLFDIITTSGMTEQLRDPVLEALRTITVQRDAFQLCELAMHFAHIGDDRFRHQLYEFVRQRQFLDAPYIGEGQLFALDGEKAFRFIARLRGAHLRTHDWEWHDESIIERAIDDFGNPWVEELLTNSSEPEIQRFAEGWRESLRPKSEADAVIQNHLQKTRLDVNSVMDAVNNTDAVNDMDDWFRLQRLGKNADEETLKAILEILWAQHEPAMIIRLLWVFAERPLPMFDSRLIGLCSHPNQEVAFRAFVALSNNAHPDIRQFAFQQLKEQAVHSRPMSLFVRNYELGDEQRLLDCVELSDEPRCRHSILLDVLHLLEENESADPSKLGQVIYFHTPCQNCRFDGARLLFRQRSVPPWLVEECWHDSNVRFRELVEPEDDD